MQNISSTASLKNAIQLLEVDLGIKGDLLKDQFYLTVESLKPVTLIKNALHDVSASPKLVDNILGITMGIASGFLTNRVFVGASGSLVRKLLGSVLQFGVTNVVAHNPETIKSIGEVIKQIIFRKKVVNSAKQ
jgi:hypothetical protein